MNPDFFSKQSRYRESVLKGTALPYIPIKNLEVLKDLSVYPSNARISTQDYPRRREIGRIIILPNDNNSPMYGEISLFYEGDNPDLFLGKIVRSVSKVAKNIGQIANKAASTVSKTIDTLKRATGPLGTITDRGLNAASAVARGERIDRVLKKTAQAGIDDVRERMKFAEMVAPFVPGIGTGVAAALGAANALAAGKPITEAMISAARSAIPGGKIAQVGFDVALNVARGKNLSQAALDAARAQIPGGRAAQAAFDAGLALAQGKKLQQAAFAAAGRVIPPSPFAADALSFAQAVTGGKNIQQAALSIAGQRVLQGKKIDKRVMRAIREREFEYV